MKNKKDKIIGIFITDKVLENEFKFWKCSIIKTPIKNDNPNVVKYDFEPDNSRESIIIRINKYTISS